MRSKRAVGLAAVSALVISGLVGVLGVPASANHPGVLVVPDGAQRGVVSVTATADDALYPFVQVGLVVGNVTSFPAGQLDGITPAPALNIGATVNLQVPTWGLHNQQATFVLMGCTAAGKASCTTPLHWEPRQVFQTNLASASIDLPGSPAFVPEEDISITTDNPGGGDMVAGLVEVGTEQTLPDNGTEVFSAYGTDFGDDTLVVRRCSALVSDLAYCEDIETAAISWIREFVTEQADDQGYGLAFVTTDPSVPATSVDLTFTAHSQGLPYNLWWALRDDEDELVAGPVQLAQSQNAGSFTRTVSPIAHAVGAGIPDGDYNFEVYGSTSKGGLTKQALQSVTVSVLNDPPLVQPPLALVDRVQRPKDSAHPTNTTAYFSVAALTDRPGGRAEFVIKNSAGTVVYDEQQAAACVGHVEPNNCLGDGLTWDFRVPVGSSQLLLSPGTYAVSAMIPDQFGRLAPVNLGALYVQRLAVVRKVVKVSPGKRVVSRGGLVKERFKLPMPEIKESYFDLSRTRVTIGFKGTSRRDRDRRVSCATTAGALKWTAYVPVAATGDQVCRLVNRSSFRGLPTRGVRVRTQVGNRALLKVKWIKAIYYFRGYVTPAS